MLFGRRSHSDFTEGLSSVQIANRRILREAMIAAGFEPLAEEWWHFTLKDEPHPDRYFDLPRAVTNASAVQPVVETQVRLLV